MTPARGKKAVGMSDAHKAALAEGRDQGRAVRRYLEALETHRPKRGRKRTPESIQARLASIDERIASADALTRLHLAQERLDLTNMLQAADDDGATIADLEGEFVAAAGTYSRRKGLSYDAWREIGVSPKVLKRAGIGRS